MFFFILHLASSRHLFLCPFHLFQKLLARTLLKLLVINGNICQATGTGDWDWLLGNGKIVLGNREYPQSQEMGRHHYPPPTFNHEGEPWPWPLVNGMYVMG